MLFRSNKIFSNNKSSRKGLKWVYQVSIYAHLIELMKKKKRFDSLTNFKFGGCIICQIHEEINYKRTNVSIETSNSLIKELLI